MCSLSRYQDFIYHFEFLITISKAYLRPFLTLLRIANTNIAPPFLLTQYTCISPAAHLLYILAIVV